MFISTVDTAVGFIVVSKFKNPLSYSGRNA